MEALHRAAAKLPRIAIARPERIIGKDTVGAMQAGVFWGYVALIEGLVAQPVPADAELSSFIPFLEIAAARHARADLRLFAN